MTANETATKEAESSVEARPVATTDVSDAVPSKKGGPRNDCDGVAL